RLGIVPGALAPDPAGPAFTGGFVGALAYDLGHRVEGLPRRITADRAQPHLWLHLAEVAVAVPPQRERAVLVGRDLLGSADLDERMVALERRISVSPPVVSAPGRPTRPPA